MNSEKETDATNWEEMTKVNEPTEKPPVSEVEEPALIKSLMKKTEEVESLIEASKPDATNATPKTFSPSDLPRNKDFIYRWEIKSQGLHVALKKNKDKSLACVLWKEELGEGTHTQVIHETSNFTEIVEKSLAEYFKKVEANE